MSSSSTPKHTNLLIQEKSPYLLQHAHNPVDWNPWGEAAFAKAQREDKLMLISIGYATCHWCHVMERESFEDEAVAAYLNANFVAVKVDREERPDVDKIYMDSLHALGQQGGWPLNMFATPDGRPIAGGTYFPPDRRHGRMAFREVLEAVSGAWHDNREAVLSNAQILTDHLQQRALPGGDGHAVWDLRAIDRAAAAFGVGFDTHHGGFSNNGPNKFPPSMGLMLLLRQHARTGDERSLHMVTHTLRRMRQGGIYDQIGGGLSRYSTDHQWLVPHFEKMLYDNALFVQALVETHLLTGDPFFREAAEDTIAYVLRDLRSPEGAFYSAEDADSEGVEGKFYVWTPEEARKVLKPEEARAALAYWNITAGGNFEHGTSIPNAPEPLAAVATKLGMDLPALRATLLRARAALLGARSTRVRPLRDDKVLTSWNGLMISALARAGRCLDVPSYREAALQAADFLWTHLRDGEGRLLRRWRQGEARHKAYLVDYTQFAVACLDLYEATFDPRWFERALSLMRDVNRLFRGEAGPYYDTGVDAEKLIARTAEGYDGVEPSGNSSAAQAFLRLHAYGVREGFDLDARRIFAAFRPYLEKASTGFPAMLAALDFDLAPPAEIAIVGDPAHPEIQAMRALVQRKFQRAAVAAYAAPKDLARASAVPLLHGREAIEGRPTAYVCRDMSCQLPVHDAAALAAQLAVSPAS